MCLAVPGRIVSIYEEDPPEVRRGKVDFAGVQKEVCLAYTPEAGLGDAAAVAMNRGELGIARTSSSISGRLRRSE